MKYNPKRVLDYLNTFGEVKHEPCDFSNGNVNYATLEMITTRVVIGNLEQEVNSRLNEGSGFCAFLRVIAISDVGKGKYKYAVEIVPYEYVKGDERVMETERFLHSLPKVIKNLRCKNPARNRR